MKQFDILVIDDERVILDSILKVAKDEDHKIDTTQYGKEGLDKLKKNNYKLIICDLILPDLNGFEIVEYAVSNNLLAPIIVTSGYSTIDNAIKAMQYGAIDFLPKPFTFDEILGCIRKGMKYSKLIMSRAESIGNVDVSPIQFIPCPPSYYRFGLTSWLNIEKNDSVKTGLTDLNIRTIDEIELLDVKNLGEEVHQGEEYMVITCNHGIEHKILAPVSGIVTTVNDNVLNNTRLIEKDPFFEGWIYKITPSELHEELKYLTSCSTDRL